MNWSHFKPEYSGKPEEDVEAHLLRMNDWMNTHYLFEDEKSSEILSDSYGRSQIMVCFIRTYSNDMAGITKSV